MPIVLRRSASPFRLPAFAAMFAALAALALAPLTGCGGGSSNSTASPRTPLSITTSTLASGTMGSAYSEAISATGGSGAGYTFAVASGTLPAGLSLSTSGTIAGTPSAAGTSTFTVSVKDSSGNKATSGSLSIVIAAAPALTITTTTLGSGTVGGAYSSTIVATGGTGSGYTFSLASGSLPAGLSLSAAGVISGNPTTAATSTFTVSVKDSAGNTATSGSLSIVIAGASPLSTYEFTGDVAPVHDPSIIRQGSTYYVFVTDAGGQTGFLPIRCSQNKIAWTACGYVFSTLPSWVATTVPAATDLWAPDISFFNGLYHLYYAASSFGSQNSGIGLATTPTLNQSDPAYKWTDHGLVLNSTPGANFNAIDPNILVDTDGTVWLTYGSFWDGIFQQQVDPSSGLLVGGGTIYHLAERAPTVANDPVEGSSLVHKGNYYYLFNSWNYCCNSSPQTDSYEIEVGRGTSRNGPFTDQSDVDLLNGGGTVLLTGDGVRWYGPGGQTAYLDSTDGDLITFHALDATQNYLDVLFVRSLSFDSGWPVIGGTTVSTGYGTASTTTLSVSPNPVTSGSSVTFTVDVSGTSGAPTGGVLISSATGVIGSCTLSSASCTLSLSTLAVGSYSITASYLGDSANAASTSTAQALTVQAAGSSSTPGVVLSTASAQVLQGLPLAVHATVSESGATSTPTGTVTFKEGATTLAALPLDPTGIATLNTAKLAVGAHSISAAYSGDSHFQAASTTTSLALTIVQPATSTYTNPLPMTDPKFGKVTSCPDPSVISAVSGSTTTWYMYCTSDPHNGSDTVGHLLSIFSSTDLVHWTYVRDVLTALPSWTQSDADLWAPAIKYLNGKYMVYYLATATTYTGGTSAIGVATATTPAGPFTDSGKAVIDPETIPGGLDGAGSYRWVFDPDVTADSTGQLYILYGSFQGGISVRKLSADGLTSDPTSETQIADDQRYEGGAWIQHGGYFYLLASATNCCAGPLTGYGVFAGRATTPMGPFLDAAGNSMSGVNVGGTPVLAMNGNTIVGPGGGTPFTDASGQAYYVYHEVVEAAPYFTNTTTTQRPAAIDAIDWVNNWPVVRGGFGPSDSASPQPVPVSQAGGTSAYTTTANTNDSPATLNASLSDEFNESKLSSQWSAIHSLPQYTLTGTDLSLPTVSYDTTNAMPNVPILAEATPAGDYMVEAKISSTVPDSGAIDDYAQGGLLIYGTDSNYLRLDLYANSDTRQVEFIKSEVPLASGYPTWSATDLSAATSVNSLLTVYARIVKRTIDGVETYTGYSSVDGTTWVRCGAWTHTLGSGARIGLYGGNLSGFNVLFDYVHVSTLQ